ncbi:MAG: molybdopterin dinucleotide binding domain-containing protein, partial [Bilophila sp.]
SMMWHDLVAHAEGVATGQVAKSNMLMFYEANPVYALPGKGIAALFKKAGFSVSFSSFLDETAMCCNLVLPAALGLERYDDVAYPFGYPAAIHALVQPVIEPLHEARPAGEVLLQTAAALGMDLGYEDVVSMLKAKAQAVGADWTELSNGTPAVNEQSLPVSLDCVAFGGKLGEALQKTPAGLEKGQLAVGFVNKLSLGTAETAIPPFNTKTITPDELNKNVLVARVNGATQKKLGLYDGNLVTLTSKAGTVTARLKVFEGVTNDTVALTLGFGHTAFETFNGGKGMNVMTLVSVVEEPGTAGLAMWNDARVNVTKA